MVKSVTSDFFVLFMKTGDGRDCMRVTGQNRSLSRVYISCYYSRATCKP
jgi:hypothetical protein